MPPEMAGRFRALTGFDVAAIPVHRGPAVSAQARAYQARAFTRAGEIFLPDEAGPVGHGDTQALLAHELTHAIQQRVLAPSLPEEASPRGQELESEASHAEQWYRSGGEPPPRLAHLPVATLLAGHAGYAGPAGRLAADQGADPAAGSAWTSLTSQAAAAAPSGLQRLPASQPLMEAIAAFRQDAHPASSSPASPASPPTPAWPELSAAATPSMLTTIPGSDDLTWASAVPAAGPDAAGPTWLNGPGAEEKLTELLANSGRLAELCAERPPDLDDPASLDELATKMYQRLHSMLRAELLVDRERAGLLADAS